MTTQPRTKNSEIRRVARVRLLLVAVVLLSLGDLLLTGYCMSSTGMLEDNPIVVALMHATNSIWALAAFKALTVAACVGMLYIVRRKISGEMGAWIATMILVALTVRWHAYTDATADPVFLTMAQQTTTSGYWVVVD